jgi:hypothetical protein
MENNFGVINAEEIGFGAASLGLIMQNVLKEDKIIEDGLVGEVPILCWKAYAARILTIYLKRYVENFEDEIAFDPFEDQDSELLRLAGKLAKNIQRGECPGWIIADLCQKTVAEMRRILYEYESNPSLPLKMNNFNEWFERLQQLRDADIDQGRKLGFDAGDLFASFRSPLHYLFDRAYINVFQDTNMIEWYVVNSEEVKPFDVKWEDNIQDLNVYAIDGFVKDQDVWKKFKSNLGEEFLNVGYMKETPEKNIFGATEMNAAVTMAIRHCIDEALKATGPKEKFDDCEFSLSFNIPDQFRKHWYEARDAYSDMCHAEEYEDYLKNKDNDSDS